MPADVSGAAIWNAFPSGSLGVEVDQLAPNGLVLRLCRSGHGTRDQLVGVNDTDVARHPPTIYGHRYPYSRAWWSKYIARLAPEEILAVSRNPPEQREHQFVCVSGHGGDPGDRSFPAGGVLTLWPKPDSAAFSATEKEERGSGFRAGLVFADAGAHLNAATIHSLSRRFVTFSK